MNMMRRILSGALAVCLVLSMLPAAAFAEEITEDLPVVETLAATEALAETAAPAETEAEATAAPTAVPTEAGTEPPAETAAETEAPTEAPVEEATAPEETIAAADGTVVASGTCGDDLTWTLEDTGDLRISGTGAMDDYEEGDAPWADYAEAITWVAIRDGVSSIGDNAFYGCQNLFGLTVLGTVECVGDYAFAGCDSLFTAPFFSEGLISIGAYAFYSCKYLDNVTIPASVTYIGEEAFRGCRYVEAIQVAPENIRYSSDENGILFNKDQTVLIYAPNCGIESYLIPETVITIENSAFYDLEKLETVMITPGVATIGEAAFAGLNKLDTIYFFGEAPEFLGNPFTGVTAEAYYPEAKASWTEEARQTAGGTLTWIPYAGDGTIQSGTSGENLTWALDYKGNLTISGTGEMPEYSWGETPWWDIREDVRSVVIQDGVTSISDDAFSSMNSLTSVTIGESVAAIGNFAFSYCRALLQVTIPASVTWIGNHAFDDCSSMTGIYVDPDNACYSNDSRGVLFNKGKTSLIMAPCGISGAYTIPDSVTELPYAAFYSCEKLTEVSIPTSVESIGSYVFDGCASLTAIHVAQDNVYFSSDESGALLNKDQTELLRVPHGIAGIYTVPASVTHIGEQAFEECEQLTGVLIPEGVTSIGAYAFKYCEGLTSISIPASVVYIDYGAFEWCSNLKEIWFMGNAPEFEDPDVGDQFYGVYATVYYPADNTSWTEEIKLSYGGKLNWTSYDPATVSRGSIEISTEYIALKQGQTVQLQAQVIPTELANNVRWIAGDHAVATVDNSGMVTAVGKGTTYVIAELTEDDKVYTARCRVDVAESLALDGISLSANKLTTELFSSDYTEFEILLELPQNRADAFGGDLYYKDDMGVAIESAVFTNEDMDGLFELRILDDRRVAVVPTMDAVDSAFYYPEYKEVADSYVTAVEVTVDGETYTSEKLTLTIKQSKPKLKVTVPTLNSFYTNDRQPVTVTGASVTNIYDVEGPDWLYVYPNGDFAFFGDPGQKASGKVTLEIYTVEWRIPAIVTATVKVNYKAPELKLSASSVTLCDYSYYSAGTPMQLLPKTKGVTLADLGISDIDTDGDYWIDDFNPEDGTFVLEPMESNGSEKIELTVYFENTDNTLTLPLSVKRTPVKLKLSQSTVTLNGAAGDAAVVNITATPADFNFDLGWYLEDSDKEFSTDLDIELEDGKLYIRTDDYTPETGKYTLYIGNDDIKQAVLKINVTNAVPTLKLKAGGNLDLSFPDRKIALTTTFKNLSGAYIEEFDYYVTETKGKEVLNEDVQAFSLTQEDTALYVGLTNPSAINVKNTYTLYLTLTLADGSTLESSVKLPVKQTNVSLKLSANKLTLNKAIADKASVTVTCATKDYAFTQPVWQLTDNKGNDVTGQLDIAWADGKLTVAANEVTPYGASYKLQISPQTGGKAVTLAITVPAENKSAVTGSLKVTGSLDVIRDGTALTVIPTWKNCNDAEREVTLTVRNGSGEDVTNRFNITEEDGKYILTRAGVLDHSGKYTVTLTAAFASGATATASAALKLKQGSAKLTLNAGSTALFAGDKNSRINISFSSADAALNGVAKVELDPKLAEQFEVFDYGNGNYAIGFKDGKVPAKITSANIALNVWLEGNETAKANASLKVKITIVR